MLPDTPTIYQNHNTHTLMPVRSLLVGRANLALLLWQLDAATHAGEVKALLNLALADAHHLRLPEAGQIEGILMDLGLADEDRASLP